jgi:hypothetical protein
VIGFVALAVAALATAGWAVFFAVAIDEDCGRLNDCAASPTTLYVAAWTLTAVALVTAILWLRRWVVRGRRSALDRD